MDIPEARRLGAIRATEKGDFSDTNIYRFGTDQRMWRRVRRQNKGIAQPEGDRKLGVFADGRHLGGMTTFKLAEFVPWSPFPPIEEQQ